VKLGCAVLLTLSFTFASSCSSGDTPPIVVQEPTISEIPVVAPIEEIATPVNPVEAQPLETKPVETKPVETTIKPKIEDPISQPVAPAPQVPVTPPVPVISNEKILVSFGVAPNPPLARAQNLNLQVDHKADLTKMTVYFTIRGSSLSSKGSPLQSGSSQLDFSSPVDLEVAAEDGSLAQYTVTVTQLENPKTLTGFSLREYSQFTPSINLAQNTVDFVFPFGTNLNAVTPIVTSTGVEATINGLAVSPRANPFDLSTTPNLVISDEKGKTRAYKLNLSVTAVSRDARLKALRTVGYDLVPDFSPDILTYTIQVPQNIQKLTIKATPEFGAAQLQLQINDSPAAPLAKDELVSDLPIRIGENNFFIRVMAEDKRTTKYYVIAIKRI